MESCNKEVFLNSFRQHAPTVVVEASILEQIAQTHLETLTTIRSGYFSGEDLKRISEEAAKRLAALVQTEPLQFAWQKIAEDFHSQAYWGYKTQSQKPKKEKKKNELVGFIWTAFQASVVMKLIVLYFGVNAAEKDSEDYYWGLGIALFVSFASLLFFAWRKSKTYKD